MKSQPNVRGEKGGTLTDQIAWMLVKDISKEGYLNMPRPLKMLKVCHIFLEDFDYLLRRKLILFHGTFILMAT